MKLSFEEKIALYNSSNKSKSGKNNNKKDNDKKDKTTLYIGKLFGKHPLYGSKKIDEIKGKARTLQLYGYPVSFDNSLIEDSITIIFVGQSGTGKSTFINAYANYLLGITFHDDIRYKLILGEKSKEKDQTKSQTDNITIYNVRSLKYNNKLFRLIDTPGAGDTRNDNDIQISKIEQDKKEKEFLAMYNNLFSNEIGQLNSITFVLKASENRNNEFQKKIIKNITNLFAGDIEKNCLAILTHTDDFYIIPDAARLLEKLDIFKKKSDNNEEWYFPVSSKSYFIPMKKGTCSELFAYTEESFENYTNKLLRLKLYLTKQTQKNLQLKEQQEKIIKVLKDDIMDNMFYKITKLEDNKVDLNQKIKECEEKQKKIDEIKNQIKYEDKLRKEIENNYKVHIANKSEIEKDLKESNEKIIELNSKIKSSCDEIKTLENKKIKPEEKESIEYSKRELKKKIVDYENEINEIKAKIDITNKRKENTTILIDEAKKMLIDKDVLINVKNDQVTIMTNYLEEIYIEHQKIKNEREILEKDLKNCKDKAIKNFLIIKIINEEIEKLTLNKSTIISVLELIDQLLLNKKYIDDRKQFKEIIEEYKNIEKNIDSSNNKNDIYKKYGIDADSI